MTCGRQTLGSAAVLLFLVMDPLGNVPFFLAALKNVDANIQLHGGIGVTDEHDAHLYLKRAHVLAAWYGSSKVMLQRILAAPVAPL